MGDPIQRQSTSKQYEPPRKFHQILEIPQVRRRKQLLSQFIKKSDISKQEMNLIIGTLMHTDLTLYRYALTNFIARPDVPIQQAQQIIRRLPENIDRFVAVNNFMQTHTLPVVQTQRMIRELHNDGLLTIHDKNYFLCQLTMRRDISLQQTKRLIADITEDRWRNKAQINLVSRSDVPRAQALQIIRALPSQILKRNGLMEYIKRTDVPVEDALDIIQSIKDRAWCKTALNHLTRRSSIHKKDCIQMPRIRQILSQIQRQKRPEILYAS